MIDDDRSATPSPGDGPRGLIALSALEVGELQALMGGSRL
jgi:hypothetical protein